MISGYSSGSPDILSTATQPSSITSSENTVKSPLSKLLDDLAITPERAMVEIERFAPHVLETLNEGEFLEDLIRRHLEKFYLSPAVLTALEDH